MKNKKSKNTSKKSWVQRHVNDGFVKKSQQEGFFSRAAYKLLEIHKKAKLFKPGMMVLDLGAAPGSWSQVASDLIKPNGWIVALDLLELKDISKIHNIKFFQADINAATTYELLIQELDSIYKNFTDNIINKKFDVIMSDMAPSLSGIASVDGARMTELLLSAIELAKSFLNDKGVFLAKLFQGSSFNEQIKILKTIFESVDIIKPKASRGESKEVYILAKTLKKIL